MQRTTGLAADVGGFVGGLGDVFREWSAPGAGPGTRIAALRSAINTQLGLLNVPKIGLFPGMTGTGGSVYGMFKPDFWIMDISPELLRLPTLDVTQRAKLADTVIHESRHAEQFFRVARLLCVQERKAGSRKKKGERRDAATIATAVAATIGMDLAVVELARQQGAELSPEEAAEADRWSQSIPFNAWVHEDLKKKSAAWKESCKKLQRFQQDLAAAPKRPGLPHLPVHVTHFRERLSTLREEFNSTFVRYGQAYKAYQLGLAFEADAWQTGQAAYEAVSGRSPADLATKLAGVRAPWDGLLSGWHGQLFTPPPRPYRDPSTIRQVQTVQRHAIPPELDHLPEGVEPIP
ncbi:hypothetical protein [Amycolatopsis sp. lyj-346]|uniref:hypothetical protein n=1 Tax=Amycolatopsis sp. lyj-346 TaxID=2789289 RepID=UPI003977FE94